MNTRYCTYPSASSWPGLAGVAAGAAAGAAADAGEVAEAGAGLCAGSAKTGGDGSFNQGVQGKNRETNNIYQV